tara:strand:+ start:207 stop:749 length:543 start_codon:yes stop_codon:yes gene_type:complete
VGEKKKRGLFRSAAGSLTRAGGATVKGAAKVTGKTAKVAAKGTYGAGKLTTKATYKTGKVAAKGTYGAGKLTTKATYKTGKIAAKGGYITMKSGGRAFLFAARRAYPRLSDENKRQYRIRMAKLGFKVSLFTGAIIMAAASATDVQQLAMRLAVETVADKTQDLVIDGIRDSFRTEQNNR